jgi:hypothetical protein
MDKRNFWNFENDKEKIKKLYNTPGKLVEIEFANRTDIKKFVWVEPTCVSIEIDAQTEYKILTHDKTFRIEFDKDETIIFYLQYSFGFILYKRLVSETNPNLNSWKVDIDLSEIN